MNSPRASVVIPAHNEEAVIGRTLRVLLAGSDPGDLDVIVVANACSDRTADVARNAGVRVIETSIPGKANALRMGDAESATFPRIYADADVELDYGSARALVATLRASQKLAAAPLPVWDLRGTSIPVRRVHRVHEILMAPRRALAGVGVYVLTAEGHQRVFPLPDVISDDGLVNRLFRPDERVVVSDAKAVIRPARNLRSHLRRRVRVRMGGRQLDALGIPTPDGRLRLSSLARLVVDRSVGMVDALWYLSATGADHVMSNFVGRSVTWSTDLSSRQAVA